MVCKANYRSAPLGGEEVKIEGVPMTKGWVSPHPESRIPSTTQTVAQTSSPRGLRSKAGGRTEAFTAEDLSAMPAQAGAEHAENGVGLSD